MTESEIIRRYLETDVYSLATKDKWFEHYDKMWLIQQIQSRQKAKLKLPSWYGNFNLLFPPPLSVEQSSSELAAEYKASLVSGDSIIDMTGGMGIDCTFFAQRFQHVTFIEQQEVLVSNAKHNFKILGLNNIDTICGNSTTLLSQFPQVDCIFLDPARRQNARKVFLIEDCQPNLLEILPELKKHCKQLLVKFSPMLDIPLVIKTIPEITDIHIVAIHNEIKELILLLDFQQPNACQIHCVNIEKNGKKREEIFNFSCKNNFITKAERVNGYLYEPHATLLKGGMMDHYASQFGLEKLHTNSHLYTSSQLHADFFGRVFQIEGLFSMNKNELRNALSDMTMANITTRNFPLSESELRKKLKLADGGEFTIFATTLANNQHVLIKAKKISS